MTRPNRVVFLEDLVAAGKADSFARYALAMEYAKESRAAEAVSTFQGLRATDPTYLPMYFMAGKLLWGQGEKAQAREWLQAGLKVAKDRNDPKTSAEILGLLDEIPD